MNYKALCESTIEVANQAGRYIFSKINSISLEEVESKGKHNFVTEVDKAAEILIINKLKELIPDAGFIAEEDTSPMKGEKYNWVIDPLDGTTNFIHGAPPVAVSIALLEENIPVIGIVYEIWLNEMFYTWKDDAAYLNGKKINVSDTSFVKDALIATGFPYHNFDRLKGFMNTIDYFFTNTHGVRRLGSAATDLAYIACGRFDGFYEYNLNPWDVAAGALIILNAGGMVADFKGENNYIFGREIVASNMNIFNEFLHDVGRFMNP